MNERLEQERLLDSMLNEWPQEPLPTGFVAGVMARVQAEALPTQPALPLPKFRLQFLDWAVPAFVSLFVVLTIVLIARWDWLPQLLEMGSGTAVSTLNITQLGLILMAIVGEIALVVMICLQLWGGPLDWEIS